MSHAVDVSCVLICPFSIYTISMVGGRRRSPFFDEGARRRGKNWLAPPLLSHWHAADEKLAVLLSPWHSAGPISSCPGRRMVDASQLLMGQSENLFPDQQFMFEALGILPYMDTLFSCQCPFKCYFFRYLSHWTEGHHDTVAPQPKWSVSATSIFMFL
jgi:hypothetical protein